MRRPRCRRHPPNATTTGTARTPTRLRAAANKNNDGSDSSSTAAISTNPRLLLSRRQVGELSVAAAGLGLSFLGTRENTPQDYGLWGVLPVGTYKVKKTIMETIVPDAMWTFDQKFGILNVQVPLRMTVIKLEGGGLLCTIP